MRYGINVLMAFIAALLGAFWVLSGQYRLIYVNHYFVLALVIMLSIAFYKKIYQWLKSINRYSWLILFCYLSGTMAMEYAEHGHTSSFEGFFITLPLALAFIFWSQKSSRLLGLLGTDYFTKEEVFKIDFFLITAAFMLAGCISVLINSFVVIGEFRAVWPFLVWYISGYGALIAGIFSIIGLTRREWHKKYTLIFSLIIITLYGMIDFMPGKIKFLNFGEVHTFYAVSIFLIIIHLIRCLRGNQR